MSWLKDKGTLILGLAALAVVLLAVLLFRIQQPSPLRYERVSYDPREVCPGDILSYTVSLRLLSAPAVMGYTETWWSVDRNEPVIPDDRIRTITYIEPFSRTRQVKLTVPYTLGPGHYELIRAASTGNSQFAYYKVPVTVGVCSK